jgi:hypothetical protein
LPVWLDTARFLGPAAFRVSELDTGWVEAAAELERAAAAEIAARLHNVGVGGRKLTVEVSPPLPRPAVRAARTDEARRRRERSAGFARAGVRLDDEARWSLTPEALALALGERAAALRAGMKVVDAGCGAGGNAIGFARAGCEVIAIERAPQRLAMARHNAAVYGVAERIRFVEGDALEAIGALQAELLFVDPPWGPDYDKARVACGDLPLLEALFGERRRFARFWAKVPPSFDPLTLPGARAEAWFGAGEGDARRVKFLLLEGP